METIKAHQTAALLLAACMLCALCGCSDYFTPWSAFRQEKYDLGPSGSAPAATAMTVPDSVDNAAYLTSAAWYSFLASKDTTYVIMFYPRYGNAALDIFDTASQSVIVSVTDSPATLFWICGKSGTYYLRVRQNPVSNGGASSGPGPFAISLKNFSDAYGATADVYEPDSTKSLATDIKFTKENETEAFQIHRIAPGDTDWFVFSPNFGRQYVLRTVGNATGIKISLLSLAGDSVVAGDVGSGGGQNARLTWICPYSSSSYTRYFYVTGLTEGAYGISVAEEPY